MLALTNPVRDYAWGSRRRLATFLGREPSGSPEAELWIGAHPGDPSVLPDGRRLDAAIEKDPVTLLGARVAAGHGRLPFLMKVLSVSAPLSLQVHPRPDRARAGYQREEAAGVPRDAAHRSYPDPSHKPELVYALTRFEGMAGFRDVEATAVVLRLLEHPWADALADRLLADEPAAALCAAVTNILALGPEEVSSLLAELVGCARRATQRGHERERRSHVPRGRSGPVGLERRREPIRVLELLPDLAPHHPRDPGVLATLLLNHVVLAPGEAMYVGAGVLHAYVSGSGLEIMASSDNVLRAGLTAKHRDVAELLAATEFAPTPSPRWRPTVEKDVMTFAPPVAEFALGVGAAEDVDDLVRAEDGPCVVVTLDAGSTLHRPGLDPRPLGRGEALLAPPGAAGTSGTGAAGPGATRLGGRGAVAVGRVPR